MISFRPPADGVVVVVAAAGIEGIDIPRHNVQTTNRRAAAIPSSSSIPSTIIRCSHTQCTNIHWLWDWLRRCTAITIPSSRFGRRLLLTCLTRLACFTYLLLDRAPSSSTRHTTAG